MRKDAKNMEEFRKLVKLTSARNALDRALFAAKLAVIHADQAMDVVNQVIFEERVRLGTAKVHEFDLTYGKEMANLKTKFGGLPVDKLEIDFYE